MSAEYQRLAADDMTEDDYVAQEDAANWFSKLAFNWVTPMVEHGYRQALEVQDLLRLIKGDKSASLASRWDEAWNHEMDLSRSWDSYIGKRVVDDDGHEGVLRWIGRLPYSINPDTYYAGVAWDDLRRHEAGDKTVGGDGWFYGEHLYDCEEGHGSFIKPHLLKIKGVPNPSKAPKTPFVAWGLSGAFLRELGVAGLFKLGNDMTIFAGPLALQAIVKFLQDDDPSWELGIAIVVILFVSQIVQSLCANQYFYLVGRVGMRMRQALSCAVFDKSLVLNERTRANPDLDIGRIVNMMSTDAQRAQDVVQSIHQLWSAPFQIIVSCVLLFRLVGVSLFAGIGVMLLATPLQGVMMKKMMQLRMDMAKFTDQRVKAVTEVLGGIRIVKFMVWTARFAKVLNGIRDDEVDKLAQQQNFRVVMFFVIYLTPLFLTASTFIVYAASGGDINAETVFPAIALFSILRFPFLVLPMQFNMMVNAKVSFDRLTLFLEAKTSKDEGVEIQPVEGSDGDLAVAVEDCTFHAYEPQVIPELAIKDQQLSPDNREEEDYGIQETSIQVGGKTPSPKPGGKASKSKATKKYKLVPKTVLTDVNVGVRTGKLTMIVGKTGSGKTCLMEAMLGSVDAEKGTVRRMGEFSNGIFVPESVAYAPQQAWIMNTTLKENILFFNPEDQAKYEEIVAASQLTSDIETLQDGDQTEIGEKGINLSGGQKQRVSIARSVYADKRIVMLDDPLSAVDPHVGKELMKNVIGSSGASRPADWPQAMLEGRTRILVTHQIQFLKHADDVIYMKDGRVAAHFVGTPESNVVDQILNYNGEGAEFFLPVREAATLEADDQDDQLVTPPITPPAKAKARAKKADGAGKLTSTEERAQGRVKTHMYLAYIKAAGGWNWFALVSLLFCLNQAAMQLCDLWLTWWTDSTGDGSSSSGDDNVIAGDLSTFEHLYVYVGIIIATSLINLCRGFTTYSRFQTASRRFHELLLANVLRAPMAFFDTTPLGRLINRFSKDIDQVDVVLPPTVITFFQLTLQCSASLIIIATSQPVILALFLPASLIYLSILKRFIRSNRETKRLDSISKSPIFQHFTETLNGMKTIHSYEVATQFRDENRNRLDLNTRTSFSNLACNRWLAIRLEILGNIICCCTALLAVITKKSGLSNSSSTGLLSLGITYSLNLTSQLNFLVRQVADLEAQMNGVERIVEFSEEIDQEPILSYDDHPPGDGELVVRGRQMLHKHDDSLAIIRSIEDHHQHGKVTAYVPTEDKQIEMEMSSGMYTRKAAPKIGNWPTNGKIVFKDVTFRYRPGLPLVLKGLGGSEGLVINDMDKIGIVGRTGAGKSTLMLALFRFVETAGGSISIGGRDIRTVRLEDLRSSLSMIPQDPVLFQGTVRSNLDPFEANEDAAIWDRLKQVNLERRIRNHDSQLDGTVTEGGQNFSVGQRQLLCLARALLKSHSKILLMDEATASIDHATDMAIQVTVREQFKDYTVLTIAHRLQTIMDSTKIMVLDQGVCAEYDSPSKLLANTDGILHDMAQKTGDFDRLVAISEGRLNLVDALEAKETEKAMAAQALLLVGAAAAALKVTRRIYAREH